MRASIIELSGSLRKRKLSPVELVRDCLTGIQSLGSRLNAFITVIAESALEEARQAEAEIQRGDWRGPLHGIPLALKDIVDTAGVRTTAASALFKDRIPSADAEVARRLRIAGAVIVGKNNLHEFAYGGSSLVSAYGPVRNPWNPSFIAGGSSGGSAAAVGAGICLGAIGTDTAGSIREPAALCAVVGLKPTYGRVSVRGVIPLSLSFDHVGPIAPSVEDSAVVLQAIAGHDPSDPGSVEKAVPDYIGALRQRLPHWKIGIPRGCFYDDLDPEVGAAVEQAISVLKELGGQLQEIELSVPTDRRLQSAESWAYHAAFVARSPELYQPETLRRIRSGEKVTAAEIERLRRELAKIRQDTERILGQVEVLVTPTTPIPAPEIDELTANPDLLRPRELLLLRNTRPANVWGLPAISVPCGFTKAGLPIGLQIVGRAWEETTVLRLAYAYEQATEWHKREPRIQ